MKRIASVSTDMARPWPDIPYPPWKDTCTTLHQFLQIVGKYKLALTPWVNHSWHATFQLSARGITTGVLYAPNAAVEVSFDFVDHLLVATTSRGDGRRLVLEAMPVATFHERFVQMMRELRVLASFDGVPNEVPDPVPFAENRGPGAYDRDSVPRFWLALLECDRVLKQFRTGFLGKVSPVHLFWGSFDLAVTRFSGRPAPPHPGGIPALPDRVTREAYSHEVSSAGFWPGGGPIEHPSFYSYAYPLPDGFAEARVEPADAHFEPVLGEFLLPYDAVRAARDPDAVLAKFLESTYAAAADLGAWDRTALECPPGRPRVPRAV